MSPYVGILSALGLYAAVGVIFPAIATGIQFVMHRCGLSPVVQGTFFCLTSVPLAFMLGGVAASLLLNSTIALLTGARVVVLSGALNWAIVGTIGGIALGCLVIRSGAKKRFLPT